MTVFEAIKARRSVRKFKDTPIPNDVIHEMLEAARLAPTAGNGQGNVIGVIKDQSLKMQLEGGRRSDVDSLRIGVLKRLLRF